MVALLGDAVEDGTETDIPERLFATLGQLVERMTRDADVALPSCRGVRVATVEMHASESVSDGKVEAIVDNQARVEYCWQLAQQLLYLVWVGHGLTYVDEVGLSAGEQGGDALCLANKEVRTGDDDNHTHFLKRSNDASQSFHTGSRPSSLRRALMTLAVRSSLTVNCSRAWG